MWYFIRVSTLCKIPVYAFPVYKKLNCVFALMCAHVFVCGLMVIDFSIVYSKVSNISRLPDFDVFSLLDIRKRNNRSHGKRKNGNLKRKNKHVLTLSELSIILKHSGRHMALSRLVTLSISSLCTLDIEANKFYDRAHRLYDAAILTRCYTQHALRPYIDSEINHIRHFIKIQFVNKGIEFINLPSIFKDKSVISSIPTYFENKESPIICYKYN